MGTLIYTDTLQVQLDDRTLEHLRFVVFEKLRNKESFPLTWVRRDAGRATASTSVWVCPETPIGFQISGEGSSELSRAQIEALMRMSYTPRGLVIAAS
ncbi:ATP-dependent DNA ligase [Leucobacter allii]|uniref:ATP-dependent DNA ligase n=1 Tax=Leucobacter allii TaxID=2932247 RepID=A0ABY4FQ81_9MICO|nr:ATP-dependent DNA ligase [Leucobacter allii]UOQ58432.1 ATP-dependent DNA ligase [Leucobacter allii]UOR03012.1 ATP-dependent DNA ligase [Leucobacter allii]